MGGPPSRNPAELRRRVCRHYVESEFRLDGWKLAEKISEIGMETSDPALREEAVRLAARAVLRRANRLVGPLRLSRRKRLSVMEAPFRGELEVEPTVDNLLGKEVPEPRDWIVSSREEHARAVCLMMDVSLSMSGRNLALAALTCAVLALKIPPGDLALVAFDSMARRLVVLGEELPTEEVVRRILRVPARGYTNLRDALRTGGKELGRALCARRIGLLVTDGVSTVGEDPLPETRYFPRLHVLMTEDGKTNEELCRRMARRGQGLLLRVRRLEEMPARMLELANRI